MSLSLDAEWERLDTGPPEERACFAALGVSAGNTWLSEAEDAFVKRLRVKVHLSAYRLAEWLAWNWWRLRWEPAARRPNWSLAHRMSSIGGGYVWPNITIISDGERIALISKPTQHRPAEPLRYVTDFAAVVRASEFEGAIDRFMDQVRGQLRAEKVGDTNVDQIWQAVLDERLEPDASTRRRLEAMLGFDPDEAPAGAVEQLMADEARVGRSAMFEIAGDHRSGAVMSAVRLAELAKTNGVDVTPNDAVQLRQAATLPAAGQVPAWRRGVAAARALRHQEHLHDSPISNARLARLVAVSDIVIDQVAEHQPDFAFELDDGPAAGRVVLRSRWEVGRRFELARLLGDRVANATDGCLLPATRTHTYRQKMQRAFAAEFLCPFDALEDKLQGDYSQEAFEDAAHHFNVSDRAVRTLLVNNGRLGRDDLEGDWEAGTAA